MAMLGWLGDSQHPAALDVDIHKLYTLHTTWQDYVQNVSVYIGLQCGVKSVYASHLAQPQLDLLDDLEQTRRICSS